jgi:hypothetical protein
MISSLMKERQINATLTISNGVYHGDLDEILTINGHQTRHGHGTMKYFNGNVYTGEWYEDCFHGTGEYIWADGRKFVGNFKKDKIDGSGIGEWPDGRRYVGEYKMDLAHGHGFVSLPNGRIFEGTFAADFPVEGEMIDTDGSVFAATFDGQTHVSEWTPKSKILIGRFEEGWRNPDPTFSLKEFAWADGRRFAGSFNGFLPLVGVLTEVDGSQYLVSFAGNIPLSSSPSPAIKIKLKTEVQTVISLNECFIPLP